MNPRLLFLVMGTAFLAACSATQVREAWTNPEFSDRELGHVLVLSIADDEMRRAAFERELASELAAEGVKATPRADVRSLRGKPGRQRVEEVVQQSDFDHVLVTRLSAIVEDEVRRMGYTEYELLGVRGRLGRYWVTDVNVIEHPAYVEKNTRLYVETSLFETGEGKVVWRMRTETANPEYHDLSAELRRAMLRRLRSDGFLP